MRRMCVVVDGFRRQPQRTAAPQFCNHCTINSRCAHEITAELSVITANLTTANAQYRELSPRTLSITLARQHCTTALDLTSLTATSMQP